MRTALLLLLLLAVAAIPGSLVPQRSADPNGVVQYERNNPELFAVLDTLQVFDTYSSVWFSSIYLLLFVSLIGCVIPRTQHHWRALRAAPPATPARLNRLVGHTERQAAGEVAAALRPANGCCDDRVSVSRGMATRSAPSGAICARPATSSSTSHCSVFW